MDNQNYRLPLTEERIEAIAKECGWETGSNYDDCVACSRFDLIQFARAIEKESR